MYVKGVRGIEELSLQGIKEEIDEGGRFVQYLYVVSYGGLKKWDLYEKPQNYPKRIYNQDTKRGWFSTAIRPREPTWKLSDVYFIYADEGTVTKGLQYSLFSLVVGIWGLRSLFWTLESIGQNLSGGIEVTNDIVDMLDDQADKEAERRRWRNPAEVDMLADQTYNKALSTWINRRYNS